MAIEYWKSMEDGHVCVQGPCSDDSIPLIGYFNGCEDFTVIQRISGVQESGLDVDRYDYITPSEMPLTTAEKRAILMEKRNEKANYDLREVYKNVPILSVAEFQEKIRIINSEAAFDGSIFLPVELPLEFSYTGVFLLNNAYQGVLHTFLRHHLQWQTMVTYVEIAITRLRPLHFYIDLVSKATNIKESKKALSNFLRALKALTKEEYNECQAALNDVQLEIVRFLQSKITYPNYRGEGLNEKTQMEVYFRMQEGIIAVLGFSRELFKPMYELRTFKPIRAVITVFFIEPEEQSKRMVVKTY